MKILITGSIAYDYLMDFHGNFKDVLLKSDLARLSVSFQSWNPQTYFGGCSTNIAYNLKKLGAEPIIFSVAGNDFALYKKWLEKNKISSKYIELDRQNPTARAYILTDKNENQIAFFAIGATANPQKGLHFHKLNLEGIKYALITPDLALRMEKLAEYFAKKRLKIIFDPGQAMTSLQKPNLKKILAKSHGLILNQYEAKLLSKKLGLSFSKIISKLDFAVETLGEKGCRLYHQGKTTLIPCLRGLKIVDITGCGDAFRGGFLYALSQGLDYVECCKYGHAAASYVMEKKGTQKHDFKSFKARLARI